MERTDFMERVLSGYVEVAPQESTRTATGQGICVKKPAEAKKIAIRKD